MQIDVKKNKNKISCITINENVVHVTKILMTSMSTSRVDLILDIYFINGEIVTSEIPLYVETSCRRCWYQSETANLA